MLFIRNFKKERNLNGPIEETRAFVRRELFFRKEHYELCDKISGILGNIEHFLQELEYWMYKQLSGVVFYTWFEGL